MSSVAVKIAIALAALVGLLAALGSALRPSHFHPYAVFQASESLTITFLQNAQKTSAACEEKTARLTKLMLGQCPVCRLVENRCLEKLDVQQQRMLNNEPVDFPVMQTPTGVVVFVSDKLELANEICRESERQSSTRTGRARCIAAGISRAATSLSVLDDDTPLGTGLLSLNTTLGLILAGTTLSLVILYLVVRSGRLSQSLTRNAGASTTVNAPASGSLGKLIKLCLDLFLAIVLLAILSPLLMLVAVSILILEGTPIFYVSRRHISASHAAPIFKFRTMVRDATNPKHRLNERFMRDGFLDIPLTCEIYTPIGRLLERTQLVETPQLLNIIFDGLSFVGNRPLPATNVEYLKTSFPEWAERFQSPAGITGIAQVVGRRNLTPLERIELETLYSRVYQYGNILICDLKIIVITVWVVLTGKGIAISQARALLQECLPVDHRSN